MNIFQREKFGNRIEWHNGKLTIKNIKLSDFVTFFYRLNGMPMALSLYEERYFTLSVNYSNLE